MLDLGTRPGYFSCTPVCIFQSCSDMYPSILPDEIPHIPNLSSAAAHGGENIKIGRTLVTKLARICARKGVLSRQDAPRSRGTRPGYFSCTPICTRVCTSKVPGYQTKTVWSYSGMYPSVYPGVHPSTSRLNTLHPESTRREPIHREDTRRIISKER